MSAATSPFLRLIVGLGNPGSRYVETRHNAGYWFVDEIARRARAAFRDEGRFHGSVCRVEESGFLLWLLKPATYMNHSGRAVGAFVRYYGIPLDRVLVAHDELDLPAGTVRLKRGGGDGGHQGVRDVIAETGGREFIRARIGVGRPGPGRREHVVRHVLGRPDAEEARRILQAVSGLCDVLPILLEGRLEKAMNLLHAPSS